MSGHRGPRFIGRKGIEIKEIEVEHIQPKNPLTISIEPKKIFWSKVEGEDPAKVLRDYMQGTNHLVVAYPWTIRPEVLAELRKIARASKDNEQGKISVVREEDADEVIEVIQGFIQPNPFVSEETKKIEPQTWEIDREGYVVKAKPDIKADSDEESVVLTDTERFQKTLKWLNSQS
jgi:hypothetical protein